MITKTCSQCGNIFELTDGEIEFYEKKGLHIPNRCKECRESNRKKNYSKSRKSNVNIKNKNKYKSDSKFNSKSNNDGKKSVTEQVQLEEDNLSNTTEQLEHTIDDLVSESMVKQKKKIVIPILTLGIVIVLICIVALVCL